MCCAQLRALLDDGSGAVCPADPAAPCRGFTGDCSPTAIQRAMTRAATIFKISLFRIVFQPPFPPTPANDIDTV